MSIQKRFTPEDFERIKSAVKEAESKISGEIVPVFVERSGYYTIANYRAAMVTASLVFIALILFDRYAPSAIASQGSYFYDPLYIFLSVVVGGIIGAAVPHFFHPAKRWFVSQKHMDEATRRKAESAFVEQEVFNTGHRTGIMIFISFFEREVIVMADRGISKVVDQKEWDKMVAGIVSHIRLGKVIDGIESAVKRCGEILLEKGFLITPDDINELSDDLRIE